MSDRKLINITAACSILLVLMGAGTGIKNVIERNIERKKLLELQKIEQERNESPEMQEEKNYTEEEG